MTVGPSCRSESARFPEGRIDRRGRQEMNVANLKNSRSALLMTDDLVALVRELARLMPDRQIARLLNRTGTQMATGKAWTEQSVHGFRKHRDIAPYREGEWAERGEITLEAAAKIIGVCNMTALRMLRRGDIKGGQVCPGAPWVIMTADLTFFLRKLECFPAANTERGAADL